MSPQFRDTTAVPERLPGKVDVRPASTAAPIHDLVPHLSHTFSIEDQDTLIDSHQGYRAFPIRRMCWQACT
jgi:hypothetical protein